MRVKKRKVKKKVKKRKVKRKVKKRKVKKRKNRKKRKRSLKKKRKKKNLKKKRKKKNLKKKKKIHGKVLKIKRNMLEIQLQILIRIKPHTKQTNIMDNTKDLKNSNKLMLVLHTQKAGQVKVL